MSFAHLVRLIARRWPIVLIGAIVVGAAAYLAIQDRSVYFNRTEVVFMAPSSTLNPNSLQTRSEDLIIAAGLVAKRVMGPERAEKYVSPDANLAGIPPTGRDYWIRLPDTGGQWAPHFADQLLLLDVVGESREAVVETRDDAIAMIRSELDRLQREQGVAPVNDITVSVTPEVAVVEEVHGSKARALGMTVALGAAGTAAVIVALEIARTRRNLRQVATAQHSMARTYGYR